MQGERPLVVEVVDLDMARVFASKTGAERLQIAFGLLRLARQVIGSSIRARHPEWPESRIAEETARRLLHGST
jgi:hypothetical protein